jgi:dTMP kinase
MTERGRLITIEGIDGTGKTTLADGLLSALTERGRPAVLLREPGGVEVSERVREVVKDPALTVGARAEALLYAAARAQLVEEAIMPRLARGEWILLDRFVDSSLAYQGAGRALGIAAVRRLNEFATGGLAPDRTLLLVLDAGIARRRTGVRGEVADRLEREGPDFYARIDAAYRALAEQEPARVRVIDASPPPEAVLRSALDALRDIV